MAKVWRPFEAVDDEIETALGTVLTTIQGDTITLRFDGKEQPFLAWKLLDGKRLCELVDVDDGVPVVKMTPEVREAAMRASAWLVDMLNDYRGDGMDDLRADVIVWRAWLTELDAQAGEEPCN